MTNSTTKIPVWYWIVSVLALIWNALGVMAYLGKAFITDEMIAELPNEQQAEFLMEFPAWYTAAFALAVFCGFFGCLFLILKRKIALILLIVSAFCAIIQHIYLFINVTFTPDKLIMPILVIVVCLALIKLAKSSISKGWLK